MSIERPTISLSDVKLRLFVDTNVLIGYIEKFDDKKSETFIELFKNATFSNIELVTSDYVLWELYGHFKDELYVRKLVNKSRYGYISALRECTRWSYRKASVKEMETFGDTIENYVKQFAEKPVSVQRLIGKKLDGFSEIIEKIIQCSKFSYQDTIVFVSALFTESDILVTLDDTFSSKNHLAELKEALRKLPLPQEIEFRKPEDFSTEESVKRNYKKWFSRCNVKKTLGKVIKVWAMKNTIAIECLNDYFIEEGDYLSLVKFRKDIDFVMEPFQVQRGALRDSKTNKAISRGKKVTIKLPSNVRCSSYMQGAMIFLYSG